MESSTPLVQKSDLRRRTLLNNAVNLSPLRKSINASYNTSLLEASDDESERSARRSNIEIQKRVSNIPQEKTPLNESYIKEQIVFCTHLFTENKITTKNAWKLQIIDMLKPLCQNVSKDILQVASTSIDISAKVYGIRVDDIHSEGLKLASSMARSSGKMIAQESEEGADENVEDQEKQPAAKKKKKKRNTGQKTTVTNTKATLGPFQKMEPVDFTTRVNADTGAIDNLFTNVLKEDCTNTSFVFLDKTMTLMPKYDPVVENVSDSSNFTPLSNLPLADLTNIRLNQQLADFKLDGWDPDQEEKLLNNSKSIYHQTEVVFDDNGIPIPELDGSIPDIFANMDEMNDGADDDIEFVQEVVAPQLRGEVAHIEDFRATASSLYTSEYSYNSIVNTHTGNFIDQIWAGPSHWKLKFIKNKPTVFSGVRTEMAPKPKKRKAPPEMIDFSKPVFIDFSKKLVIKKRPPKVDINKITLPLRYNINYDQTIDDLMLKPGVRPVEKKPIENLEYDVGPYKYENPNDSLYCSQHNDENGGGDADDNLDGGLDDNFENAEHMVAEQQNFLSQNLVDAPQMVPETYVPYAMKAKQMDMKKLKSAIWQKLTNNTIVTVDKETQQRSGKVAPTKFSEMYTKLPENLAEKEKKELSCPLAFVALLHLCNEQNLELKQLPGYKDFEIMGPREE